MTNAEDMGFVEGLKKFLNIKDSHQIQSIIESLGTDQLSELAHAVNIGDKAKVLAIYYASKEQKLPESVNRLNVGDLVYVMHDDKKVKARVKIPNGPGDTVGVMIGNKMKMKDRANISLTEDLGGVMGMTMLPGLARMQELAGLSPTSDSVTAEVVEDPELDDHMMCVMNALSALEEALPNVALKDAKIVRARLTTIMQSMNESAAPKARKLKD